MKKAEREMRRGRWTRLKALAFEAEEKMGRRMTMRELLELRREMLAGEQAKPPQALRRDK